MNIKETFEVQNTDKIKTLIELLDKHRKSLPDDLIKSLNDLADCDACEIGYDELANMGLTGVRLFCNGKEIVDATSFNPILKRVTSYWSKDGDIDVIGCEIPRIYTWPLSLDVMCNGVKIESISW